MKKKYQGSTKVKRAQLQALRRDFETLHMKPDDSVDEYFSKTMAIASKMRLHGDKMDDVTIIEKIMHSMSPKFNYVVCAIEEANDIETINLKVMTLQKKRALKVSTSNYSSSSWRGSGRGQGRGEGAHDSGGRNHDSSNRGNHYSSNRGNYDSSNRGNYDSSNRGKDRYRHQSYHESQLDKSNIECYRCGRYGHYCSECRTNMNRERGEKSNFTEKEEATLLLVCQAVENTHQDVWYIDTGCSNHMSGNKSSFSYLDESFRSTVRFCDNSVISVMGVDAQNG
ncbi:uncharacterized protein LOC109947423 [Prunus persica]|uniref:uncharacterized protein LOC109947423 n=1 Tax=Prunus persica TaxID=3760 RepID=UPI0009AB591E|nr:uncharacterized protein LOC109947423 [Prunus persica]